MLFEINTKEEIKQCEENTKGGSWSFVSVRQSVPHWQGLIHRWREKMHETEMIQ